MKKGDVKAGNPWVKVIAQSISGEILAKLKIITFLMRP
jgi:hypothetical protein